MWEIVRVSLTLTKPSFYSVKPGDAQVVIEGTTYDLTQTRSITVNVFKGTKITFKATGVSESYKGEIWLNGSLEVQDVLAEYEYEVNSDISATLRSVSSGSSDHRGEVRINE